MTKKYSGATLFAIAIAVAIGVVLIMQNVSLPQTIVPTSPETPGEGYIVDALVQVKVADILDQSTVVTAGSMTWYDPAKPGIALDSDSAISNGYFTSTKKFRSGQVIAAQYTGGGGYLSTSMLFTMPRAASNDAGQTLEPVDSSGEPLVLYSLQQGDFDTGSSGDVAIQKNGIDVWNGSSVATDAFDPQATDNYPKISIRIANDDADQGYGYKNTWVDYSDDTGELTERASYWVISFDLSGSSNTMSDVDDYLKFNDLGGATKVAWGTSVVLFIRADTDLEAGWHDHDSAGNDVSGRDGSGTVWSGKFDFSGYIGTIDWSDEIDIELSFVANYALTYALNHETLSQNGDAPLGEISAAWSYDCSIG